MLIKRSRHQENCPQYWPSIALRISTMTPRLWLTDLKLYSDHREYQPMILTTDEVAARSLSAYWIGLWAFATVLKRCEPFDFMLLKQDVTDMLRMNDPSAPMTFGSRKFGSVIVARLFLVARTSLELHPRAPHHSLAPHPIRLEISRRRATNLKSTPFRKFWTTSGSPTDFQSLANSPNLSPLQCALVYRQEPLGAEQTLHEHHPLLGVWPPAYCPQVLLQ